MLTILATTFLSFIFKAEQENVKVKAKLLVVDTLSIPRSLLNILKVSAQCVYITKRSFIFHFPAYFTFCLYAAILVWFPC